MLGLFDKGEIFGGPYDALLASLLIAAASVELYYFCLSVSSRSFKVYRNLLTYL